MKFGNVVKCRKFASFLRAAIVNVVCIRYDVNLRKGKIMFISFLVCFLFVRDICLCKIHALWPNLYPDGCLLVNPDTHFWVNSPFVTEQTNSGMTVKIKN